MNWEWAARFVLAAIFVVCFRALFRRLLRRPTLGICGACGKTIQANTAGLEDFYLDAAGYLYCSAECAARRSGLRQAGGKS